MNFFIIDIPHLTACSDSATIQERASCLPILQKMQSFIEPSTVFHFIQPSLPDWLYITILYLELSTSFC